MTTTDGEYVADAETSRYRTLQFQPLELMIPLVVAIMELFLTRFAATLPDDVHAVMVLDGAG